MNQEAKNPIEAASNPIVNSIIDNLLVEESSRTLSAEEILDSEKQWKDVRVKIAAAAEISGKTFDDGTLNKATDLYFDRRYRFVEPARNFQTRLGEAYIDRARIGKKYGLPLLAALAILGTAWTATRQINNAVLNRAERRVETLVQTVNAEKNEIASTLNQKYDLVETQTLPRSEKAEAYAFMKDSKDKLESTDDFFVKFFPKGSATETVTRENYSDVEVKARNVLAALNKARENNEKVTEIVKLQDNLVAAQQGLEDLMKDVKHSNPNSVFSQRAETAYESGLADVAGRNLAEARIHKKELAQVASDIKQFAVLPTEEAQTYSAIKAVIARDELEGLGLAEQLHEQAQTSINSVNVPSLAASVASMKELDATLNQEYSLRVVSRPGVKSGIDRYYQGRFSGWYVISEAFDTRGNIVSRKITSCEDGRVYNVNMWGEKVAGNDPDIVDRIQSGYNDNSLLVRVIRDKMDNGIVDNNLIGEKKKGYLHDKLNHPDFQGKQITEW